MKLNLGSDGRFKGWVNVDLYHDCDVRASIVALPFPDGCAEQINASHVLEHVTPHDAIAALREIRRVLAPTGTAMLRGPDALATQGTHEFDLAVRGMTNRPGMAHLWVCCPEALTALAHCAGLTVWPSTGKGWPDSTWIWPETILEAYP